MKKKWVDRSRVGVEIGGPMNEEAEINVLETRISIFIPLLKSTQIAPNRSHHNLLITNLLTLVGLGPFLVRPEVFEEKCRVNLR
jgi:hypothetical protein